MMDIVKPIFPSDLDDVPLSLAKFNKLVKEVKKLKKRIKELENK